MNQMTSLILLIISSLLMNLTIAVLPEVFAYENGQPITLPTTKKQGLFVTGLDVRDPNDEDLIAHPLPTQAIHTTTIKVLNQNVKIYGWEIPFGTDIAFEVAMGKWRKLGVTSITTSCATRDPVKGITFEFYDKEGKRTFTLKKQSFREAIGGGRALVGTYTTEQAVQPPLGPRVIFWKGKELVPAEVQYIEKNWLNKKDKNDKFTGHYESYGDYDQYNAEYYDNQYYDQMEYLIERAYERGFKKGYISGSDKHRKSSKMIKRLRH